MSSTLDSYRPRNTGLSVLHCERLGGRWLLGGCDDDRPRLPVTPEFLFDWEG